MGIDRFQYSKMIIIFKQLFQSKFPYKVGKTFKDLSYRRGLIPVLCPLILWLWLQKQKQQKQQEQLDKLQNKVILL